MSLKKTNLTHFIQTTIHRIGKPLIVRVLSLGLISATILSGAVANLSVKAATISFQATIVSSGSAPYDSDDTPGNDSSAANNIIRSNDELLFSYLITPTSGAATNTVITHTLTSAIWQETFPFCTNSDQISADKYTLKCVLGYVNSTLNLTTKAWTNAHYNSNGSQVTNNITVTSDNSATVTTTAPTLTISSNPKYHLLQGNMWDVNYYQQQTYQLGPDGVTPGIMYTPLHSIKIQGADNSGPGSVNDVKGNAVPTSITYKVKFEDADTGALIPDLKSYTWGGGDVACGYGANSYAYNLNDINCSQTSSGSDINVSLSNFNNTGYGSSGFGCGRICDKDWRNNNINSLNPSVFADFQQSLFVMDNYTTRVWIPNTAVSSAPGQQLNIKQTVYDLQVTASSLVAPVAQTNRIPSTPDSYTRPSNTDSFRGGEAIGVSGGYTSNSTTDINGNFLPFNQSYIYPTIPGSVAHIFSNIVNQTINIINNGTLCQKWDKNLFEFRDYNYARYEYGPTNFLQNNPGIIEYGTSQDTNLDTAECGNSDGPWYNSIAAVPGGKANISKVRTRGIQNIGYNQVPSFNVDLIVKNNPAGTTVKTYTSFQSPDFDGGVWAHQLSTNPKVGGSFDSPRGIYNKSIGTSSFEKLNGPAYLSGQTAKFKLNNAYFTQQNTTFNPATATLISEATLPVGVGYVPGSAKIVDGRGIYASNPSVNPSSVVVNGNGTTTVQWTIPNYLLGSHPYDNHSNITFDASFSNTIADNTQAIISTRVISAEQGCLSYSFNCTNNSITIYKVKDVYTELSAPAPFSQVNTPFSFDMKYGNGSIGTIDYDSIVKLKPSGQGSSLYSGDINITNVTATNGEIIYYSATATSNDPADPSNVLPNATWTTNLSSLGGTVKAFRIIKTGLTPSSTSSNLVNVTVTPVNNKTGDRYQNEAFYRFTGATGLYGSNSTLNNIAGGALSGTVFNNFHSPSVKDNDENGLAGISISLSGPVNGLTTTDNNGLYKFENLPAGAYTVTAVVPSGYAATLDKDGVANTLNVTSQDITFSPTIGANSFSDIDFGFSDSLAPSAPTITTPVTIQDSNKLAYSIIGTCEPLATVTVSAGTITTTSVCQTNSTYAVIIDVSTLPDGSVTITVKQSDQTNNTSPTTTDYALKVPSCTNGSNSPTTGCNVCPSGQQYVGNTCVTNCTNGALNPPSCNQCPVGQVYIATGNTTGSCVANCNNGASNPSDCNVTCTSGTQVYNATLNSCVFVCSNGTTNPVACNTCPVGQNFVNNACVTNCTNGATNPSSCNVCPGGQTYNGTSCITNCANGSSNPPICTVTCPSGQAFNFVTNSCITSCTNGATNPPACNTCPYGQTYSVGSANCVVDCTNGATNPSACNICPATKYLDSNNQCNSCPAGSSCILGSTNPLPCPAGTYCLPGVSSPTTCSTGTFCPQSTISPTLCAVGSMCVTPATQVTCTSGSYCPAGSTTQTSCALSSVCTTPATQVPCASGSYCPISTAIELPCAAGSYCSTPATQLPCTSGNYCPASTVTPITCVAGTICPANSSTPITCSPGNYCPTGAIVEAGCLGGYFCATPSTQVLCTAGTYCPPSTITPIVCSGGVICPAGSITQTPCDAGFYCPSGSTAQNPCTTGSYCPPGSITQTPCAAGNYCSTPISQLPCTAGNYCPASTTTPIPCSAGFTCPTSTSTPIQCSSGTYCPAGSVIQTPCLVSNYCTTPATQVLCAGGNYCPAGSTVQKPCLTGNFCTTPATQVLCAAGNYCPAGSTVQTSCLSGNFCATPATQVICPSGTYCPSSTVAPVQCAIGSYCTTPATQILCINGTYCPIGTVAPSQCAAGSYCTTPNTQVLCTEGNYCTTGSIAPVQCPAQSYCISGLPAPLPCPYGKLSPAGSKTIADCLTPTGTVLIIGSGGSTGTMTLSSSSNSSINNLSGSNTSTQSTPNSLIQSNNTSSSSTTNNKSGSYYAKSIDGKFKDKLEISDPYVCGEGSYGNVSNPVKFGVKNVFYDFYKNGNVLPSYKFKLDLNTNGDFFLPISKTTNIIEDGNYRVVFYAFDSEGNKAEGEYSDYISMNCNVIQTANKIVNSIQKTVKDENPELQPTIDFVLARTGGFTVVPFFVILSIVSLAALAYLSITKGNKKES